MIEKLQPISAKSVKDNFIEYFENLILSGEFSIHQKLPPERELSKRLEISRPIIHDGLLDLENKGLVKIVPRKGVFVNDYRKEGSIYILESILKYSNYKLNSDLFNSFLEIRIILESNLARNAAINRTDEDLKSIENIIDIERNNNFITSEDIAKLDFEFHHCISIASGNVVAPLLINSFKKIYIAILDKFYKESHVLKKIFSLHEEFYKNIKNQNQQKAQNTMLEILNFGEQVLREILKKENNND